MWGPPFLAGCWSGPLVVPRHVDGGLAIESWFPSEEAKERVGEGDRDSRPQR